MGKVLILVRMSVSAFGVEKIIRFKDFPLTLSYTVSLTMSKFFLNDLNHSLGTFRDPLLIK